MTRRSRVQILPPQPHKHQRCGNAKLLELYRILSAEEAAAFLEIALQTVRNMTARHQLPCIRTGKRGVGYRVIDLIGWQEHRLQPMDL
ncbi:MAG: helix-turn-helix domain-containing protein [Deltaproteobacteria bacterium]|nr:helix-turn-helix domain-containing protein [Deltaproteobacteria bacterium]